LSSRPRLPVGVVKGFGNAGAHGRGGGPEDHASMPTFAASFGA
jgi:hypothetical protein